jgi:hypothetical protein
MRAKDGKRLIHIARHAPTGAEIPIIVHKMGPNNTIENFEEFCDGRKCFSLDMIADRWKTTREIVIDMVTKYEVPLHMRPEDMEKLRRAVIPADATPMDYAVVFEEYVFGMEKVGKIQHSKLKSRPFRISPLH